MMLVALFSLVLHIPIATDAGPILPPEPIADQAALAASAMFAQAATLALASDPWAFCPQQIDPCPEIVEKIGKELQEITECIDQKIGQGEPPEVIVRDCVLGATGLACASFTHENNNFFLPRPNSQHKFRYESGLLESFEFEIIVGGHKNPVSPQPTRSEPGVLTIDFSLSVNTGCRYAP
ncbi:MAG: hypothetical protein AABX89_04445 [Candidatus Thermoplasmatota archaeon]